MVAEVLGSRVSFKKKSLLQCHVCPQRTPAGQLQSIAKYNVGSCTPRKITIEQHTGLEKLLGEPKLSGSSFH